MPCNSDYMAASGQELESKRVCGLIVYLYGKIGKPCPSWISEAASEYYGNVRRVDEATQILCAALRSLTEEEVGDYVYDGRNKDARKLASWWERHQEWDARRVKEETESRQKIVARERALQKLTTEEMEALGLL